MAKPKDVELKARVTADMKSRVEGIAEKRGESVSLVVREALGQYLERQPDLYLIPSVKDAAGEYKAPAKKKPAKKKVGTLVGVRTIYRDVFLGDGPAGAPCPGEFRPESWGETIRVNIKKHPRAAFALRVHGDSMIGAKIYDGDILLFAIPEDDEALTGKVVAAHIDGNVTIKTLVKTNGKTTLKAENPAYPNPVVTKNSAVQGVMIGKI